MCIIVPCLLEKRRYSATVGDSVLFKLMSSSWLFVLLKAPLSLLLFSCHPVTIIESRIFNSLSRVADWSYYPFGSVSFCLKKMLSLWCMYANLGLPSLSVGLLFKNPTLLFMSCNNFALKSTCPTFNVAAVAFLLAFLLLKFFSTLYSHLDFICVF